MHALDLVNYLLINQEAKMSERMHLRQKMCELLEQMPYEDNMEEEFEFIPTDWLQKFIRNPQVTWIMNIKY